MLTFGASRFQVFAGGITAGPTAAGVRSSPIPALCT